MTVTVTVIVTATVTAIGRVPFRRRHVCKRLQLERVIQFHGTTPGNRQRNQMKIEFNAKGVKCDLTANWKANTHDVYLIWREHWPRDLNQSRR